MAEPPNGIRFLLILWPLLALPHGEASSYTPQTKGKVERTVGVIKSSFWPGVCFSDLDDLNEQARACCDRLNQKVHRTTLPIPMDLWVEENLRPLPQDFVGLRFGTQERKVSFDGFISYDGVQYGLPSQPRVAGLVVLVRERKRELLVFSCGQLIATLHKQACSKQIVVHPDQFRGVAPAIKQAATPLGHHITPPQVEHRRVTRV
jgi:hypothetical protein